MKKDNMRLASVFLALFMLSSIFAGSVHAVGPFDDTIDFKETGEYVYFFVLDLFGVCDKPGEDIGYNKENAVERCEGYGLRGGNFLYYIILPILLAYLIFFAVMEKANLFNKKTAKNISIVLALLMAPLGVFRWVFITLMSLFAGTTVILLYIFLFVFMIGWGYKNWHVEGKKNLTLGQMQIEAMDRTKKRVNDHEGTLKQLYINLKHIEEKLHDLENDESGKMKAEDTLKDLNTYNQILVLRSTKDHLEAQIKHMMVLRDRGLGEIAEKKLDFDKNKI